jgi:hypothetical protein
VALADLVDLGLNGLGLGPGRQGLELGEQVLEGRALDLVGRAVGLARLDEATAWPARRSSMGAVSGLASGA